MLNIAKVFSFMRYRFLNEVKLVIFHHKICKKSGYFSIKCVDVGEETSRNDRYQTNVYLKVCKIWGGFLKVY